MNLLPTFLWKLPRQKPKFNDVCILFEHSNFAPECWKCTLKGPDFKIFSVGMPAEPPSYLWFWRGQVALVPQVFSSSIYSKAFVTFLKPY